ncbi:MBL fold metallo-hydrolase [Salsipaludibacter albus]|uniref:MBL fold metallo-hydrolase n=1 Tax=Salsipaludibacter albus TaxID=2849650 RepID=UPI001EE44FFA|nr:MBL fold metallo-hydrolase [Salsipaludibacter albus]MBY5162174.1 MBL fold metallo-hydrolase [Salsipaludibacter albus]
MQSVLPGVHQLSMGSRGYLVDGDQGVTLVDTGVPGRLDTIAAGLDEIGRTFDDLAAVVVTHGHIDHLGSAADVQAASDARLFVPAGDAAVARGERPPTAPPVMTRFGPLASLFVRLMPTPPPVEPGAVVREDDAPGLPDDWQVVDTPGHTPGHVSYLLDRAGGIMFVGDAAWVTRRGTISRGPMNRATPEFDASLRHLAEFTFASACFGHSRTIASGASGRFRAFATTLG